MLISVCWSDFLIYVELRCYGCCHFCLMWFRGVNHEMDKKIFLSRCCIYYSYLVPLHFIFGSAPSSPPPLPFFPLLNSVHVPKLPLSIIDRNKTISKQSSIIFSTLYQEEKREWWTNKSTTLVFSTLKLISYQRQNYSQRL